MEADKLNFFPEPQSESAQASILKFHNIPRARSSREERKHKKCYSEFYFKVKNHHELFEIGKYYLEMLEQGKKSLAFYSEDLVETHKMLLGLSSFFNYHRELKPTLIISDLEKSFLKKFLTSPVVETRTYKKDFSYQVLNFNELEIIEYKQLKNAAVEYGQDFIADFASYLAQESDLLLSEMPDEKTIGSDKEFYFPVLKSVESLTLVLTKGKSRFHKTKSTIDYFTKYGLSVDSVVFTSFYKK